MIIDFGNSYALLLALVLSLFTLLLLKNGMGRRAPILLHNVAWIVSLGIIGTDLVHYNTISTSAWLLITLGIFAFNLGVLIPATVSSTRSPAKESVGPLVSARLLAVLLCAYAVGHVYYLRAVIANIGFSAFFGQAYKLREAQTSAEFLDAFPVPAKLLFYLGPLLFILAANAWTVGPTLKRRTRLGIIVYVLVSLLSSLARTQIFQALMWQVGVLLVCPAQIGNWRRPVDAFHRWRHRQQSRSAVALALLVTLCFGGFQVIAHARGQTSTNDQVARSNVSPLLQRSGLTSLSIYATAGIPALSNLIASKDRSSPPEHRMGTKVRFGDHNPQTWGRVTGQGFLKVIPIAKPWEPVTSFTRTPIATNVYTWYEPYYRDFREPGVVVLTFLSGLWLAYFYRRRSLAPHYLLAAALLVGCSGRAPFVNQITEVYTLWPFLLLVMLGWWNRFKVTRDFEKPEPSALLTR